MKSEKYYCDIEGCENDATHKSETIQVIFTTDQTEGRSTSPYLECTKLDLCEGHFKTILKGQYIFADGAQGHNHYHLKAME